MDPHEKIKKPCSDPSPIVYDCQNDLETSKNQVSNQFLTCLTIVAKCDMQKVWAKIKKQKQISRLGGSVHKVNFEFKLDSDFVFGRDFSNFVSFWSSN